MPADWRLPCRAAAGRRLPLKATGEYATAKDRYNRVEFEPVRTTAVRIEARLQKGFPAGIMEWRMVEADHG